MFNNKDVVFIINVVKICWNTRNWQLKKNTKKTVCFSKLKISNFFSFGPQILNTFLRLASSSPYVA